MGVHIPPKDRYLEGLSCLGIFLQENSRLFIRLPRHFPPSRGNMRWVVSDAVARPARYVAAQPKRETERKSGLDRLRVCALLSVRFDAARARRRPSICPSMAWRNRMRLWRPPAQGDLHKGRPKPGEGGGSPKADIVRREVAWNWCCGPSPNADQGGGGQTFRTFCRRPLCMVPKKGRRTVGAADGHYDNPTSCCRGANQAFPFH